MQIPKWLIATAGLVFVVLIAFLHRSPDLSAAGGADCRFGAAAGVSLCKGRSGGSRAESPVTEAGGAMASPFTASTGGDAATKALPSTESASLSNTSSPAAAVHTSQAAAEARARVSTYFKQMEALQSGGPIDDQETFAATVLQGAVSGDFSGIDDLVRAAGDAERRGIALQPPNECAEYHRMAVTLLQESVTMITALRDGLKRNDTNALASIGASAQSMKSRAETLAAAEKALRTRFGL